MLNICKLKSNLLLLACILSASIASRSQVSPKYEMRAVWIATVANIDWPSVPGLPVETQKKEMVELLDLVKQYHLNTVVFQVRPAADAFYPSALEPWSQWLTGRQGQAPDPLYDPLQFTIDECRKRGIDIHVWLNPYRAVRDTVTVTDPNHITNLHPGWFINYGGTRYFDPGLPETRDFVSRVVTDIVKRYNIDAVHMDDYFYPYRITGKNFPDDSTFNRYHGEFTPDQHDDWRRQNVDLIIKQLHDSIKAIKPWVEFGISPFGVWRNIDKDSTGSRTQAGQTNYDDLFADIQKWQKEGWIDYVTPQIYWEIGKKVADFSILTDWWSKNSFGIQTYIGQAPYRINPQAREKEWQTANEILMQIGVLRSYPNIKGSMFFSAKFMRKNPLGLQQKLLASYYIYPSLPPANPRISPVIPDPPLHAKLLKSKYSYRLNWNMGENTKCFVIYNFGKDEMIDLENPGNIYKVTSDKQITIDLKKQTILKNRIFVITSVSQTNTESQPVKFQVITH